MKKDGKVWMIAYVFFAIFEPPFLPVPFIYVLGAFTILIMLMKAKKSKQSKIFMKSGMSKIYRFFLVVLLYSITISLLNELFISDVAIISNRIKSINQLIVLSGIQFINIWYIITRSEELNYDLNDLLDIIIYAGFLQGICAVAAYLIPSVRSIFVHFGDINIYSNAYVWERRGYGFSMTLLDTFGYGMGLIAGYALLTLQSNRWKKILSIIFIMFGVFVNARTGLIIFSIAIVLYLFKAKHSNTKILKIILGVLVIYFLVKYLVPELFLLGINSSNITIKWVAADLMELYNSVFMPSSGEALSNASFLSNLSYFPTNIFELLFGSGHSIYDTNDLLGFRSDVGYVNLVWLYGILGLVIFSVMFVKLFIKAFKVSENNDFKCIAILNMVSYFIVEVKAILIGYNPGVIVTYLMTFALIYYGNKEKYRNEVRK